MYLGTGMTRQICYSIRGILDTYKSKVRSIRPTKRKKTITSFFKKDILLFQKSEGKKKKGTYTLNTNGA